MQGCYCQHIPLSQALKEKLVLRIELRPLMLAKYVIYRVSYLTTHKAVFTKTQKASKTELLSWVCRIYQLVLEL
jgi:hypothetical protein